MERELAGAVLRDRAPLDRARRFLLRAMLLQAFYSVRSERQLMERMEFRPAVSLVSSVWVPTSRYGDASTFSKNRDRLLEGDIAGRFLTTLMARPRGQAAALVRSFSASTAR